MTLLSDRWINFIPKEFKALFSDFSEIFYNSIKENDIYFVLLLVNYFMKKDCE